MSYRVEIKVVIYAETRQVAESFAAMVETYIGESFTPETAVYTARIEEPLDIDGKPQGASQAINSIDDVAAICHSVTGLCCHILGSPGGPCTIGNCAAVRGYLGGPEFAQGASRDASSEPYPPFMYCPKCGDLYTGRGGTDGFPMTLTCPNQHSWTDPRPTELRTGEQ